ncbi:pilus assembly protein TadG-related protein [Arthrobacter sp. NPDC057009]|uniref:pilus assembly protein TadG-related protein n=1 Tax=Arthrobacter sp. NPDC057009 TaxID=3345996 RepID=UPI003632F962
MRGITAPIDHERGGIAVIVALLMVVLLGFAAIAVDVAKLYSEQAQLQNGSDAVALAVARNCAVPAPSDVCADISEDLRRLANENAVDGQSTVQDPIDLNIGERRVTATTTAKENSSSPDTVSLFFARVLGLNSAEVSATSSVTWGSPTKGTAPFPLAFSVCQVSGMVGGGDQLLQSHDPSANNKGTPGCTYAGQPVPGGFSWITQTPGICGSSVDLLTSVSYSNTGNDAPSNCTSTVQDWQASILDGKDVVVLLPVFDRASETGSSGTYHLTSFAAFKVRGWKLASGNGTNASLIFRNTRADVGDLACTGDCRGIIGSFIKYVSLADGYTLGPVSPYGATVVELTS